MIEEFIKGIHLTNEDKINKTTQWLRYLRDRNESKAFQLGLISGMISVFTYLRYTKMNRIPKIIYSLNLFTAVNIFVYEIVSKMYTNKEVVYEINKILHEY